MSGVMSLGKKVMNQNSGARERTKQTKTSPADVIMWSGCKDSQTVSDMGLLRGEADDRVPIRLKRAKLPVRCRL